MNTRKVEHGCATFTYRQALRSAMSQIFMAPFFLHGAKGSRAVVESAAGRWKT